MSKDAVQPFHMKKIQRVSTSSIVEFPTLAINDVNENVNDDDGACPADACTVGTTEWKVKPCAVTAPEDVNAKVRNQQWQWI